VGAIGNADFVAPKRAILVALPVDNFGFV